MDSVQALLVAAGAILGKEVLAYLWKKFIRVADGSFVTDKRCEKCKSDQEHERMQADEKTAQELRSFKKEIREELGMFRGILVIIALGKPVSEIDLQRLISGARTD